MNAAWNWDIYRYDGKLVISVGRNRYVVKFEAEPTWLSARVIIEKYVIRRKKKKYLVWTATLDMIKRKVNIEGVFLSPSDKMLKKIIKYLYEHGYISCYHFDL